MTTISPRSSERARRDEPDGFRQRLLEALACSIAESGYQKTTVADIVRRARTSRRTFYQYFADREACFVALLTDANADMIAQISAAVDPHAPWRAQVRQAVHAWIAAAEAAPALTLSWIRDVPALGPAARNLQRDTMDAFVAMIQELADSDEFRTAGVGPVSRPLAMVLLGGLRELMAATVEDGGQLTEVTELAVQASVALLGPTSA